MIKPSNIKRTLFISSRSLTKYGFIGTGNMGVFMAGNIFKKMDSEDELYIYDVNKKSSDACALKLLQDTKGRNNQLVNLDSIKSFVAKVNGQLDFIMTMVPEGEHVKSVVRELITTYKENKVDLGKTVILDSSTIDIPTSTEIHNFVKNSIPSFDFIDAPVSGGCKGARNGTLSFMLSRPNHHPITPELEKLLKMMGKNIFHCGTDHGAGLAAKLSNNYLLAITNLAVADSFQLANSFGLNLKDFAKLVSVSTGKSWASVDNCPIPNVYPKESLLPADNGYTGGFMTKLTRKDLVLATKSAKFNNRSLFLGEAGKYWYDKACEDQELANKDLGILYEWLGNINTDELKTNEKP